MNQGARGAFNWITYRAPGTVQIPVGRVARICWAGATSECAVIQELTIFLIPTIGLFRLMSIGDKIGNYEVLSLLGQGGKEVLVRLAAVRSGGDAR